MAKLPSVGKSMISITSKGSAGAGDSEGSKRMWLNPPLHDRCTMQDIEMLRDAFLEADNQKLFRNSFRELLRETLNVEYDDDEYNLLFLKIDTDRNGEILWDELVSHLILGYFTNDPDNQKDSLEPPIMGLPKVIRSMHRHPISRVTFCPEVDKHRNTNWMLGNYVTASRDGMINWWSLNMTRLRHAYSTSTYLKLRTTWVTDLVCLPDVSIICTSTTERELRFYDCQAQTFTLKINITSWEYMICCMHYHFNKDINKSSMLILGDVGGNVRVLLFSPVMRGPFMSQASKALTLIRHVDLQKRPHMLPSMKLVEFPRTHSDWVRQVSFYASLHCVVSCATCPHSLLMCDLSRTKTHTMFSTEKGILCFAFDENAHVLVTGGPDCTIRVWNPFVPIKPNLVLTGHHAGVVHLVLQDNGSTIFSLSRDRVIKVWDVASHNCLQTYIDIPSQVGERTPLQAVYNPVTRHYIIGAIKIAILTLAELINPKHTDGFTHSRAVSQILYNPLFKIVITCGMDSIIINWDPKTGKRNVMVRDAHTRTVHSEEVSVEITAACFDPGHLLLCTGARDGTLKVWNFNTGECLRKMYVEHMQEVTGIVWIEGRIFSVGWDRHVTEFAESGVSSRGKPWERRHRADVLAAAARPPLSLATASYTSELLFWKLETGQPYRQFSCTEPMLRIKLTYTKRSVKQTSRRHASPRRPGASSPRPKSPIQKPANLPRPDNVDIAEAVRKAQQRQKSPPQPPAKTCNMRPLAVHTMIFLQTRPFSMHVASLMVAVENGMVQGWSDHPAGGFQGAFLAVHRPGDYVAAFATDLHNNYLFTGTTSGYIKTWLMTNYLRDEEVHVNMPALRLEFPFLWKDRIEGRAKRRMRDQPLPLQLNSYRGHLRSVTCMAYIDEMKLVLSGSSDYSVRVWRLSGEYLQTLGGIVQPYQLAVTRLPPDVKKVASFTTFKVWRGGWTDRFVPGQKPVDIYRDVTPGERGRVYGHPAGEPLLGKYFQLPKRPDHQDAIVLDDSLPTIPLYAHLRMASTVPVRRPPTPELVKCTRIKQLERIKKAARFHTSSHAHVVAPTAGHVGKGKADDKEE